MATLCLDPQGVAVDNVDKFSKTGIDDTTHIDIDRGTKQLNILQMS